MMTDKSVRMICITLLLIGLWGVFVYCLASGQELIVIKGVGAAAAILSYFSIMFGMINV